MPDRRSGRLPLDDELLATQKIYTAPRRMRTLGAALLLTLGSAVVPGSGHLVLRRRAGWYLLGGFLTAVAAGVTVLLVVPRRELIGVALTTRTLKLAIIVCVAAAIVWLAVVLRTYAVARPRPLGEAKRFAGAFVVTVLCVVVAAPFGFAAYTANVQRNLLNTLFPSSGGPDGSSTPAGDVEAINKPRINIFLVGSDAGSGRIGTRTDTMVVASVDTRSGRAILFSLPRNIAHAPFPPDSKMADLFPDGFGDRNDPASGLLNGVYAYGHDHPDVAPQEPTNDPGLNLLMSSVSHILGLELDFFIQVNMKGFASIIDALGGLDVNVGPKPVPMGGIGPFGEEIKPFGYIPAGRQHLSGEQALWFARSRKNSSDYIRMGRQRCLLQYLIDQKSPMDVLKNFNAVAGATKDSVSTNIPQELVPALVELAGKAKAHALDSVAFDPSLPDPGQRDGHFDTGNPDYDYVRQVVKDVIAAAEAAPTTTEPPAGQPTGVQPAPNPGDPSQPASQTTQEPAPDPSVPAPTSLGDTCNE